MRHPTKKTPPGDIYAVAIRDDQLYLFFRIIRAPKDDIYVSIPTGRPKKLNRDWNPHASYHSSGRSHQKADNRENMGRTRQKPDSSFIGTEELMTRSIATHEPKAFGEVCDPAKFTDMFEISVTEISAERCRTNIVIDAMEPGGKPTVPSGSRIIRDWAIRDRIPWIKVTVFEPPTANALGASKGVPLGNRTPKRW